MPWAASALPAIPYVLVVLRLVASGRPEGTAASLGCFLGTLAAGTWHIMASRSSTASIGFVFLPTLAAISGMIALGFGASRRRPAGAARVLGIVALIVAAAIPALELLASAKPPRSMIGATPSRRISIGRLPLTGRRFALF